VALDKIDNGSSPEEIHFQYPHLSLAQIHSALAYYYDHQAEFDTEITRQLERMTNSPRGPRILLEESG